MKRSLLVAAVHALLVLAVWGNYEWEKQTLPRAWTKTGPFDPYDLLRGRYVRLAVLARGDAAILAGKDYQSQGQLFVENGQLHMRKADCCQIAGLAIAQPGYVRLLEPASFFISQAVEDPSNLKAGDELWVELSLPAKGPPRPLHLARKTKDGAWIPLY